MPASCGFKVPLKNGEQTRNLAFAENLGLESGRRYLVFDFWNERLEGVFEGSFQAVLEPHDTRVFILRPLEDSPQYLATDRHLTGAYGIIHLSWDKEGSELSGSLLTLPGQSVKMFFHVPDGTVPGEIKSSARLLSQNLERNLLKLEFEGNGEPVQWTLFFSRKPR